MHHSRTIFFLAVCFGLAGFLDAATYYVSPTGNDNNKGTSTSKPWRTIGQVTKHAWSPGFQPGDQILFQGGQTFTGSLYIPLDKSKGTAANPIIIGSYGTGRATLQASAGNHAVNLWAPSTGTVGLGFEFRNLNIRGVTGGKFNGLIVYNDSSQTLDYLKVENCEFTNAGGDGLLTGRTNTTKGRITHITLRNVVAHSNPGTAGLSDPTGSGLIVGGADGALIEHCIAYNNGINNTNLAGPVGFWIWDSTRSIIQFCESYENKTSGGDGGGFDIDGGTTDSIIQYCYSHNNDGSGFLFAQYPGAAPFANNHIRYNISQNDGRKGGYGGINVWGSNKSTGVANSYIYHNVVYITAPASDEAFGFRAWDNYSGIKVWNNIFYLDGVAKATNVTGTTAAIHFQNNLYYRANGTPVYVSGGTTYNGIAAWRASGNEVLNSTPVGMEANPLLTKPGGAGTLNNTQNLPTLTQYQLQSGSPAINAGLDLATLFGITTGGKDFYGTSTPIGSYDIGAHESNGGAATSTSQATSSLVLNGKRSGGNFGSAPVSSATALDRRSSRRPLASAR
jgi:hypothetical protein